MAHRLQCFQVSPEPDRSGLAAAAVPAMPSGEPTRVVLWAGRRGGRPWLRWLQQQGHTLPAVIDISQSTVRAQVPVMSPLALKHLHFDRLLVSVGTRGARAEIRADISRLRPDLIEGQAWWALR